MKECNKYQKYVDKYFESELTDIEKNDLFAHIKQCSACHDLFSELEDLDKDLFSLKKVKVPDDFVSCAMNNITEETESISWTEKVRNIFMSQQALRVNFAFATVLLFFLVLKLYNTPEVNKGTDPNLLSKNELDKTESITAISNVKFYISLPSNFSGIESVSVVGDFNGWDVNSFKLNNKDDGIWEGVFQIKPGKYEYMFVINGEKWIPDPKAREYKEDGFGGKNSILVL